MRFLKRHEEEAHVNLTPLIDVVFLLLIFFMVTTTFDRHAELKVDLPEASAEPSVAPKEIIELIVDAGGRYFLNGQPVVNTRPETLTAALRKVRDGRRNPPLIIRADARTPHQSVVTAMDVAGRIGLQRMSIATSHAGDAGTQ
ncbi:MAG: biopolymer transporter ExbD [Pseudomonadota bacterium]|nr:biopolymer transporter ExbD [Pseudomonadota bacterium]